MSEKDIQKIMQKAAAYDKIRSNNSKAGKASSAKLTAEQRKARAKKAAQARWSK